MPDCLKVGDRMHFSFELIRQTVAEEIIRAHYPNLGPDQRTVRLDSVVDEPDGSKTIYISNVDEDGKRLPGWPEPPPIA